jgi:FkbM family methyltransferase
MDYKVYYAQNREDIILSGFFNEDEKGFYVDIGANDPSIDSVTKYFYLKGWRGINIEPIESLNKKLKKERPRDLNLQIGISEKVEERTFREYKDGNGLSTLSESMQQYYESSNEDITKTYREYTISTRPLRDVFAEHTPPKISFMKVDVEGLEYEVLSSNDWTKYRPQVLCIEANHRDKNKDWRPLLKKANYKEVFFDGLNEYYVDTKVRFDKKFSYVTTTLNKPLILGAIDEEMQRLRIELSDAQDSITHEKAKNTKLTHDMDQLRIELHNAQRTRDLAKALIRSAHNAVLGRIERLNSPAAQEKTPTKLSYRLIKGSYLGTTRGGKKFTKMIIRTLRKRK